MSNKYWTNVLRYSLENSELLKDFQQISSKIDDYSESYLISFNIPSYFSFNRTGKKGFRTSDKSRRPISGLKQKRHSCESKMTCLCLEQEGYQACTLTNHYKSKSKQGYSISQGVVKLK